MESIIIKSGTIMQMFDGKIWRALKPLKSDMSVNAKKSNSGNTYRFIKKVGDSSYQISVDVNQTK